MKSSYLAALAALALLTTLSLALNGVLISTSLRAGRSAHRVIGEMRTIVARIAEEEFSYDVELEQEIPISTEIPFSESFRVPVNTVVPIDTVVVVPVDLGFTTYKLTVPIETVFPVDMEITVPISQVVNVTTVVPLELEMPVDIAISETPLAEHLRDLDATLKWSEEQLESPIWQR